MARSSEIVLYKSPKKALILLGGSSVFVVMGWFLYFHSDANEYMALATMLFFGLGLPISIFNLLDRRPQISINKDGVYDRSSREDRIPWNLIQNAYVRKVHNQSFVCLELKESFKPKTKLNEVMGSINVNQGFQQVNISLGPVQKVNPQKIFKLVMKCAGAEAKDIEDIIIRANQKGLK